MEEQKQVKYDIDGYDTVTSALRELLNQYPALAENDEIAFASLDEDSGKAMFPLSGAVQETSTKNILGKVTEVYLYPFCVDYRAKGLSENNKSKVKEWLDTLGMWIEQKKVLIDGNNYRLQEYPTLTEERKFLNIERQSPGYLEDITEDATENWRIYISARYQYEYYK